MKIGLQHEWLIIFRKKESDTIGFLRVFFWQQLKWYELNSFKILLRHVFWNDYGLWKPFMHRIAFLIIFEPVKT